MNLVQVLKAGKDGMRDDMTPSSGLLLWRLLVAVLMVYGVCFVYSTGYVSEDYPVRATWTRHIAWSLFGCVVAFCMSRLAGHDFAMRWLTWCGYGASLLMLALVLMFGTTIGGARRWLSLGPLMLQSAEFAKVFTMLAVCRVASPDGELRRRKWRYLLLLPVIGLPFALIVIEPSYGNAFSLLPGAFAVLGVQLAWRHLWRFMMVLLLAAFACGGVYLARVRAGDGVTAATGRGSGFFRGYHVSRLASYLTPAGGWNERQSVMTLAGGGLTGKGYLNGTMKSLGYLPRTVAPTDFIFAVVGEEMGFLFGTLPLLVAYALLVTIGLRWSSQSTNQTMMLNGVALMTLFCTHVLVNVGMTVRLVPVIGLPLPLLSYGGSFTLAMFLALGIVSGLGRRFSKGNAEYSRGKVAESEIGINLLNLLKLTIRTKP